MPKDHTYVEWLGYELSKQHESAGGSEITSLEQACAIVRERASDLDNVMHAEVATELYFVHGRSTMADIEKFQETKRELWFIPDPDPVSDKLTTYLVYMNAAELERFRQERPDARHWRAVINDLAAYLHDTKDNL